MKKNIKTQEILVLLSIFLLSLVANNIFCVSAVDTETTEEWDTGVNVYGIVNDVYYNYYLDNYSDIENDGYNYQYQWSIEGINETGGTESSKMIVEIQEYLNETYTYNTTTFWIELYKDTDKTAIEGENISTDTSKYNGDESFYEIGVWYTIYSYNVDKKVTYTFYNAILDEYGDEIWDETTEQYLHEETPLNPTTVGKFTEVFEDGYEYYDYFWDEYKGNVTMNDYSYSYYNYGYDADQSIYTYNSDLNSENTTYFDMYSYFSGYTIYNDSNKNGYIDLKLESNPAYDPEFPESEENSRYIFNSTKFEPKYQVYYLNFSTPTFKKPIINSDQNAITFGIEIPQIWAAIVPYAAELDTALYMEDVEHVESYDLAYIPYENISFSYVWSDTKAELSQKNDIGPYWNNPISQTILPSLNGLSLTVNYWGYIYTEASQWSFNGNQSSTQTTAKSDLIDLKAGDQIVASINATGSYLLGSGANQGSKKMQLVMLPDECYSMLYAEDTTTENGIESYDSVANWGYYLFSICFNDWSGKAIDMDPTFATYMPTEKLGNSGIPGYNLGLIMVLVGCVSIILTKKMKVIH